MENPEIEFFRYIDYPKPGHWDQCYLSSIISGFIDSTKNLKNGISHEEAVFVFKHISSNEPLILKHFNYTFEKLSHLNPFGNSDDYKMTYK